MGRAVVQSDPVSAPVKRSIGHRAEDADISQTLNYLRTKVDTLDSKLDILLGGAEESTENNTSIEDSVEEGVEEVTVTVGDVKPVQLISAQRIPFNQGSKNRFIIRLKNTSDGQINYRIFGDGDVRAPDDVAEESNGVLAVGFNVTIGHHNGKLFFQAIDLDYENGMTLILKNILSDPTTQNLEDAHIPLLEISPAKEAVYDPGHNITVTATLRSSDLPADDLTGLDKIFSGLDLSSREFKRFWSSDLMFDTYVHPGEAGKAEESYTMNTANHAVGGFLSVYTRIDINEGTVVISAQPLRSIVVRPSNQTGPFPPGYLGFINEEHHQQSTRGNELRTCRPNDECWIHCYAIGETVTSVTVIRVLPDGSMGYVPSARSPPQLMSTMHSVQWKFEPHPETLESDGITTFMCSARNENTGQVAVKLVDVLAATEGSIDSERSSVQVEANPINSNQIDITLNCAISGRPLPDVWFSDARHGQYSSNSYGADLVISSGQNGYEGIARKVFTVSSAEYHQLQENINSGQSAGYSCTLIHYSDEISASEVPRYTFALPGTVQ
ncbi:hypothetical protein RRG08_021766 [Elysia crispata]|uniref:Ig-like domain-containing protein n=1 Tax=Elysia crispata TaxID=231223 RepID=A0AAE0ZY78_9GAST|nr:hypothetical protein RRG08_021766 [Elysia crispata]